MARPGISCCCSPPITRTRRAQKLDAAFKKLGIPQGAKFFVTFRQFIAEHTDTNVEATTAAEYLKKLD